MYSLYIMINLITSCLSNIFCDNAFECISDPVIESSGNIYSRGYRSTSGRTTSITISGGGTARCDAAFACDGISFIDSEDVWCLGSNSCRNVSGLSFIDVTKSSGGQIRCVSSNSCTYSNLQAGLTGGEIICDADQSCAYSNIEETANIYAYGSYSLIHSMISSSGIGTSMKIELFGYNAGFGTNITCKSSDVCYINCYGNACYMTYIQCMGNCIITTNSTNSTIHPITDINEFSTEPFILSYDSHSLTINNDQQCNENPNSITYDNARQHLSGPNIVITADNHGAICCRGMASCFDVPKIQFNATTQQAVVCSGYHGCKNVGMINNNNGPIFCEGYRSCYDIDNIITTNNVYCFGYQSCWSTIISAAQNVFCSGRLSCDETTINSNGNINIYLLGQESGNNLKLYCNINDSCFIVCGAKDSCTASTFNCDGNCMIQYEFGYGYPTKQPNSAHEPSNSAHEPTQSPITSDPTRNSFVETEPRCSDQEVGFVDVTYLLSTGKGSCIQSIIEFIYKFINIIDTTYAQHQIFVRSNLNITDQTFEDIEDTPFCGDISFHIFSCFNDTATGNILSNHTKLTEIEEDINEKIDNNTIIYIKNINIVYINIQNGNNEDNDNNVIIWIIVCSLVVIVIIALLLYIKYTKEQKQHKKTHDKVIEIANRVKGKK